MAFVSTGVLKSALVPGEITAFTLGGFEGALVLLDSGDIVGFENKCTHQPIPLSDFGEVQAGVLVCHAHGACFDLTSKGKSAGFPAKADLKMLGIQVSGDGYIFFEN